MGITGPSRRLPDSATRASETPRRFPGRRYLSSVLPMRPFVEVIWDFNQEPEVAIGVIVSRALDTTAVGGDRSNGF